MHLRKSWLLALALPLSACSRPSLPPAPPRAPAPAATAVRPFAPQKLTDPPGIHNLLQASPRIYSGSEPHGEEAFANLATLGVKTVVSVDGARPDIEGARKHGLRYVHIPIGYDGVPKKAGESLARLVRESEGAIYVHCHHGQHRGPAAAAVACIAAGDATAEESRALLEAAGTGKNYQGLWRDVAAYAPPPKYAQLPELVETAEVESFAAAMAKIDRNFDNLKLCQQAEWSVPPEHPDIVPAQESLILKEGMREAIRNLTADRNTEFKTWLAECEALAMNLEDALARKDPAAATEALQLLEASCKQCHGKYRN
jgi:protein tyrosine phosphatase (PTP) superfamily phosphohydrolase (DUF442 family)/cytochrome c556